MKAYLGIDLGSTSVNFALIDENRNVIKTIYLRNQGPIPTIKKGISMIKDEFNDIEIAGVGATGSGRSLAGVIVGADIVKNEITAHAMGTLNFIPDARTIIEIGGQDSKLILLNKGVVIDFAMNTVCAAGCGAFLDAQANKLGIDINEFGDEALKSKNKTTLSSRCTVFCESDVVHKLNSGVDRIDILNGLAHSLVRNYVSGVGKGKEFHPPVVFQGAPSKNKALVRAFENELKTKIIIPPYADCIGAIGIALVACNEMNNINNMNNKNQSKISKTKNKTKTAKTAKTRFKGFEIADIDFKTRTFECKDCPNNCEIIKALENGKVISCWGDRCTKYSTMASRSCT